MTLEIYYENTLFCESPREFTSSVFIANHKRYNLGDQTPQATDATSWEDATNQHLKNNDLTLRDVIILPVYMLDHSSLSFSTVPFNDRYDSGEIGFIYEIRKDVRKEFNKQRISSALENLILDRLKAEIQNYQEYVNNECYSFFITDNDGNTIDSVGCFIGSLESVKLQMKEYIPIELHSQLNEAQPILKDQ